MATATVPAIRILCLALVVASTVCVLIGRNVCLRVTIIGFRTDWNCDSREFISIHDWTDYQIEGQWFVFISSILTCAYFAGFGFLACAGRRIGRIEALLSLVVCLVSLASGGLEAWYASRGYQRRVPGFQAEGYVQSYIAAAVGYLVVGLLCVADAIAGLKGTPVD